MAGHSKWANIRFRKGAQDKKRAKIFTKISRDITIAARENGPDAETNPRLRLAIDKAYQNNMTKDSVNRAIKKGAGSAQADELMHISYEGYGPKGIAFKVDCLTDNKNRSVSEVRHAFSKHGGSLGKEGSVAYLFDHIGLIILLNESIQNDEALFELAIENAAIDLEKEDQITVVKTKIEDFAHLCLLLKKEGYTIENAEIIWEAKETETIATQDQESIMKMIDKLEEIDDVQDVYHNAELIHHDV